MDQLTEQQLIETSLEYMKFCSYVLDKEIKRFNLDLTVYHSFVAQLPGILDVNFDIAYNRCAFMYKYTMCNMFFFKDCMKKFLLECTEIKNLIMNWKDDPNARLCSLSCGPGLDYLSFMLALSDHICPPSFKNVTILSKHGAWRNTVGMVADVIEEGVLSSCGRGKLLNFKNVEVVQANLFKSIPMKGYEALQHSNVILMVKSLNLTSIGSSEEEIMKITLGELASSLRNESVIFCIDTKPSVALFLEILSKFSGKFLYKPTHSSSRVPVAFSEDYKENHGGFPVLSVRGAFFVWQKLSSEPNLHFSMSPIKALTDVKEIPQNSVGKALNESDEVSNITQSLKQLIFTDTKSLHLNLDGNDASNLYTNGNIDQSVPTTCKLVNTSEPFSLHNNDSSPQSVLTHQLVQDGKSKGNFDLQKFFSHTAVLKKSNSIDSFFERSSEGFSFLGDNALEHTYPSFRQRNDKVYPISFPQHNASEIENDGTNDSKNTLKNNQTVKPSLKSKATQTEMLQPVSNSSSIKDLTERVKRLISSLENEAPKNNCDSQKKHCLHGNPYKTADCLSCPTHYNSDVNISCGKCYQPERENSINCCKFAQMNNIHCTVRHMVCSSDVHCCGPCICRYHASCCRHYENSTACASSSLAQPKIVIPLQNVNDDLLLQIVSAAKSDSKSQK